MKEKASYHIRLIVEGDEEEAFFEIVRLNGIPNYIDLSLKNAQGFGNIGALYQGYINDETIDCLLAVYDVDYRYEDTQSPYRQVQQKLLKILGSDKAVQAASLCTNPNILQMILLGCDRLENVSLQTTAKRENTTIVEKYWPKVGIESLKPLPSHQRPSYDASRWQLDEMIDSFAKGKYHYKNIFINGMNLSQDLSLRSPGSTLFPFLIALEKGDVDYFEKRVKDINDEIEAEGSTQHNDLR